MSIDWDQIANEWHAQQPHPKTAHLPASQQIKIGDYPTAVRLATATKFAGPTQPEETAAFWQEFQGMNKERTAQGKPPISPQGYMQTLGNLAPLSFALHGRPPTMAEMSKLHEAEPKMVRTHYEDLPDKEYPTVTAGAMAAKLMVAHPYAQKHVGQPPNKLQGAIFAHGGYNPDQIDAYYRNLASGEEAPMTPKPPSQPRQQEPQAQPQSQQPSQPQGPHAK